MATSITSSNLCIQTLLAAVSVFIHSFKIIFYDDIPFLQFYLVNVLGCAVDGQTFHFDYQILISTGYFRWLLFDVGIVTLLPKLSCTTIFKKKSSIPFPFFSAWNSLHTCFKFITDPFNRFLFIVKKLNGLSFSSPAMNTSFKLSVH